MMKRIRRIALLAFFAASVTCAAARATTLMRMSIKKMAQMAEVVVRARCVANAAGWDAGEIWTVTTFQVEETWKGAPGPFITVRLLGGRAGNLTSTVDGVPRFQRGEDVVLFLERSRRGDFSIVSWIQGTFRIRLDRKTSEESAAQDTAGFATYDPETKRFEVSGNRGMRLGALQQQVAMALSAGDERKP
ncbi:MAG TPA: hypothetical protein VEX69_08640 [Candidatus Limnocylindria bacterium]|nr:hypothetical protein [Candidatus Limnocylindria bacterium]